MKSNFLLFSFVYCSCSAQNFKYLSKKIEICSENRASAWHGETFNNIRIKLYNDGKLNDLLKNFDTLYLMQSFEIESGVYIGRIWSKKKFLNYQYKNKKFSFDDGEYFNKYSIELLEKWDTVSIRRNEKQFANTLPERWVKGIKVVKLKKRFDIMCISYRDFSVPKM